MKKYLFIALGSLLVAGCHQQAETNTTDMTNVEPITAEQNQPHDVNNHAGVYKGYLPAADVAGIKVHLTLDGQGRYVYVASYDTDKLDTDNWVKVGQYSLDADKKIITLKDYRNGPNQYLVGNGTLTQLDMDGELITGEFADMYVLKK